MEQVEHLAAPPLDGATAVLALIERVALDPAPMSKNSTASSQCTNE